MKHLGYVAVGFLAFVLGTLVPLRNAHAQADAPTRTFYQIAFMKSKPAQNWVKMERELWKPIHAERINSGHLNSWTVMTPVFSGPHPYDYITVEGANSVDDFTKPDYQALATKVWGKENLESRFTQTMNTRDEIGSELWEVVESASKAAK